MKVLQIHSKYKKRGGEETVLLEEKAVLEAHGHKVIQYLKDNSETENYSKLDLIRLSLSQRKNSKVANELHHLLVREKPDICHVHNVYPLISPVVYAVCQDFGIPVIQTLHNYKMLCTNSLFFRNGQVCEICLKRSLMNSVKYSCYKNSLVATAVQADAIQYHRRKGTWNNQVDAYVCLTEFHRQKMIEGGLPLEKLIVKPNFTRAITRTIEYEKFFLFVGRLDYPKGLEDLLGLIESSIKSKFVLIGDSDTPEIFSDFGNVEYLGPQSREIVLDYMSRCQAVVFPSRYYEGMPMVILEAFALQKPVVARNVGAMSSMIRHGENGMSYLDLGGLIQSVQAIESEEGLAQRLGKAGYQDYADFYSVEKGYENLLKLYKRVKDSYGV